MKDDPHSNAYPPRDSARGPSTPVTASGDKSTAIGRDVSRSNIAAGDGDIVQGDKNVYLNPGHASQDTAQFRSNIESRFNSPFVGRDDLLARIRSILDAAESERVILLHGVPGAGKSELAREFARTHRALYPGGTFLVGFGPGGPGVELANVGGNYLGLRFTSDLSIDDKCVLTLMALASCPSLLIYDNVPAKSDLSKWLPKAGANCHVLITTVSDAWDWEWDSLEVTPLSEESSLELIRKLSSDRVARDFGRRLSDMAGGLPVQICPQARALRGLEKHGRLDSATLGLAHEASESFSGPFEQLTDSARLLMRAAAFLNCQRLPPDELFRHLSDALEWTRAEFDRSLDECADMHLLEGATELRMHQLLASFVTGRDAGQEAEAAGKIRTAHKKRFLELAGMLAGNPADLGAALRLTLFPLTPVGWTAAAGQDSDLEIAIPEGERVGEALHLIGRFDEARPWFERAVEAKQKGDVHGEVDHQSLGRSLQQVGYCLSSTGKYEEAQGWYERAVEEKEKGDVHGRVDHQSLGSSLHQVGYCLSSTGKYEEAQGWYERAVEEMEKGDVHGRVDHESLGISLHQVGYCLSSIGKFEKAQGWYERAVKESEKGDVHGSVDHASLAISLQQVGNCLSKMGRIDDAKPWFEWAAKAEECGVEFAVGALSQDSRVAAEPQENVQTPFSGLKKV